jgi:hypothetical protein
MTNKSLFLGAAAVAALSLLMLFAFVGCSNPSSSDTAYVSQAASDYPYPADTVTATTRTQLDGLLNDTGAETNGVPHIRYTNTITTQLEIPTGKTVYLDRGTTTLATPTTPTANIIVREGATLVLVDYFATSTAATPGKLLVRGNVEVFRSLKVGATALDVADYTEENGLIIGRNTVIGKNVNVLPGAILTLALSDIIPPTEYLPNKFTPAQAWAAAGQGHLVIGNSPGGSTPRNPAAADALVAYDYTVQELLSGVAPSASRTYTAVSGRIAAETLPAVIPAGAYILTNAIPRGSVGNTLTVYGALSTQGTLNDITKIEMGNGGILQLTEPSNDFLTGLTELKLGPGATFDIANSIDVSLKSLETLFLGDGSAIFVPGTNVTFNNTTPIVTTLGKNVVYQVGMSASATVNTVINDDASLVGNSILTVYPGSTFTVNPGVIFSVEDGSAFDISNLPLNTPAVQIDGTVAIAADGVFIGPDFATVQANPEALFQTINLGDDGKVVLSRGAEFSLGTGPTSQLFIGADSSNATYEWSTSDDGAELEINADGIIIRDTNGFNPANLGIAPFGVTVTIAAPGAGILKDQSLYLDRGVTLAVDANFALYLMGDTEANGGGAKLLGPGKVTAGTIEFTGGNDGWQAIGNDIGIVNITTPYIFAMSGATPPPASVASTLKALGLGTTITVPAAATLEIRADTTIDLNGTMARKNGEILLENTAVIALAEDDSVILTGAGPAGHTTAVDLSTTGASAVTTGLDEIGITNQAGDILVDDGTGYAKAVTTAVLITTPAVSIPAGNLFSLIGTAGNPGTVTATVASGYFGISSETVTDAAP